MLPIQDHSYNQPIPHRFQLAPYNYNRTMLDYVLGLAGTVISITHHGSWNDACKINTCHHHTAKPCWIYHLEWRTFVAVPIARAVKDLDYLIALKQHKCTCNVPMAVASKLGGIIDMSQ